MRRKVVLMFLMLAGCLFISNNAIAGWTQGKGHSYNQLTLSHYKTEEKISTIEKYTGLNEVKDVHADPYKKPEAEFNATKLSYYVEYGIKDDLTVIFSGGFEFINSNDIDSHGDGCSGFMGDISNEKNCVNGVGDIILGLRQKISDNVAGGPLSAQLDIKIPEAYEYENPLLTQNLGDGQYDALLKLKYGKGFSSGYAVIDAGYKYRFKNDQLGAFTFKPSDTVVVSLSGGYNATPWLSIRGKIDWDKSIGNARVSDEFIAYGVTTGVLDKFARDVMILDSLALEKDSLTAGLALAFTVAKNMQVVASYDWTLDGSGLFKHMDFGPFKSRNSSIGETISLALAYSH